MLIKPSRIQGFDDWVDLFHQWREEIGYPTELVGDYHFETRALRMASSNSRIIS